MASGGAEEDDEGISRDIDDVHMLLHVEQEQIQKRTFTNWINAQLAKRRPPLHVSDLFSDLKDGSILLDLLEVITGLPMKRQRGHGVFQQRADIETALDFLRKKSLVNINIPDIIDGKPSIILDLIWTIILHCHIEEMAYSLSSSFPHSSVDSLKSLESSSSTPPSATPVPSAQTSLHKSFGLSAKKVLLTWAKDQCQRVGCPVSIKNFKSSWRSGEAFLAILSSLRPQLVDLTRARSRSHLENLEEAFELAERELHIPRLLAPQDVDVSHPDEKSIMTFVAQFLQLSIDVSSPNVNLQKPILETSVLGDRQSQSLLSSNQNTFKTDIEKHQTSHPSEVKVSSEGPSQARKAKSRLEKARVRIQSRIQQATKLFSNREISQAEAKRKQKALKMLHPTVLDDFLSAVEDFGSFCFESQLQDLMLFSDSLRKQWEDVRMVMAAYIPMLWSNIREEQALQVSVLPCEIYPSTLHEATYQTHCGIWQQQQEPESVWTAQEQEWTVMSETTNPQHKIDPISQEVLQRVKCFNDVMNSVDGDNILISESINKIISKPINISSLTLTDPSAVSELEDINNKLQTKIDQLLDQKKHGNNSFYSSIYHIRQYLGKVLSAIQALDHFLAILRKVKIKSDRKCDAVWDIEIQQTFEQSESTDIALKDVGLRLSIDGVNISCGDIVTKLFKELKEAKNIDNSNVAVEQQMKVCEKTSGIEGILRTKGLTGIDTAEMMEYEEQNRKLQCLNREALETRDHTSRRRTGQVKDEGKSLDEKRLDLEEKLKEVGTTSEELGLQEPTLPALEQRSRALMKLKNCLSDLQSKMEHIQSASQSGNCDVSIIKGVEDLWEVTSKAVSERLEQCNLLTELLKKYQKISAEVSETVYRAESTIREQASYMGRENLQRLQIKITEAKTELNQLQDRIEELRSVSRQLHTHLLQIPQCTSAPFEPEADSLMDQWLDISERVESHVENLHFALSLWDGVLKLGAEVESWAINKLAAFAHTPTFQKEEDIKALQDEVEAHEESIKCFHRITIDIQSLLQSADPPLELQVLEPQVRKKLDELKDLVSEAEDVYRQTEAALKNVTDRMTECFSSLHNIHQFLISISGTDPAAVVTKLKDMCLQLHVQDEQVQGLLEDLQVLSSVGRPESLQSLCDDGQKLQDSIRALHELFSEVKEQTQGNIQVYDRLHKEHEHLKQWLNNVEDHNNSDSSVLQQDVLQQRVRTEALSQLVLLLRNSTFQQMPLIEESGKLLEQQNKLEAVVQVGPREKQNRKQELSESLSPQSCVKEVKQLQSPVSEYCGVQRGLHVASTASNRLTCASGNMIDDLKHEVQETKTGNLLRVLQTGVDCPSSTSTFSQPFMMNVPSLNDNMTEASQPTQDGILEDSLWFELEACLSSLKAQLDGVCCPREDVCNEEQFGQLLQDCRHKLTFLQEKMSTCQNQSENTAATPTSYLEQEGLLQQLADMEKDLSRLVAQIEPVTCVSQQLNNLLNHKRALDNCMRERMVQAKKLQNQQVAKETLNMVSDSPNGPDCTRPTVLSETGLTQVNLQLHQQSQTEQTQPPSFSQLSPILDDTISISNISCKSLLSTLPQKENTAQLQSCFSSASNCQPLPYNQNNIEIESKNLFHTEEKHPVSLGHNKDAKTSFIKQTTLDTFPVAIHITCTNAQDSESEMIGNVPSCSQCAASEVLPPTNGHKEQHITSCMEELQSKYNRKTSELRNSHVNCDIDTACNANGTTALDCKQNSMTPISRPILHTIDDEGLGKKLTMAPDSIEDMNVHPVEVANDGNKDQENITESSEKQDLDCISRLLQEVCKLELPVLSEDIEVTQGQITVDMEMDGTGGQDERYEGEAVTSAACKHKFTMRDILSGVQDMVESSSFIEMEPQLENCCLKSSSSEAEIYLMRTAQKVLACRYQPAQLSITAMLRQLDDAENYRCSVQEQVAAIKSTGESLKCLCDAALLDGSATVQVKAAQLDQVKQYHRQLKIIKAFLEVVATEQEKIGLLSLESHELEAQLNALLKTMHQKTCLIDELVRSCGQLSVHLTITDSLALVANLRDIQEEWGLLEENIKRALQHASNSSYKMFVFKLEANRLQSKLQNLLTSLSLVSVVNNFQSTIDLIFWTADLKLYNQLYSYLRSQFDTLAQFSMGQKEKDNMERGLEEVGSLFNVTKMKLGMLNKRYVGNSSSKIDKHLEGLIIWAKKAESRITTRENLALFPGEACIQIAEMETFQKDVICKHSSIEQFQGMDNLNKGEHEQIVNAVSELYETISSSLCQSLETMKDNLKQREQLLDQFASMDIWLAEMHSKIYSKIINVDTASEVDNDITNLEKELITHKVAAMEIESHLKLAEQMEECCKKISAGLSLGESRYLVNRLSGVRIELEGLLAHTKANIWELEEHINQWTTSDEELSSIETSLEQISIALKKLRFPLTIGSISDIGLLKHMLIEHECQVKDIRYPQETKRGLLLDTIGELLDKCNTLTICANEQDRYLKLKQQMEKSRDTIIKQISSANNKAASLGDRFRLCQKILVELPLVKTQCQEAADQLETIAQELYPSELNTERQRIHHIVKTLISWEQSITEDIKNLESKLLLGLRFETELHALMELMQKARHELEEHGPIDPEEKTIDVRLQKYWVMWRNMESGMRVLEGLARKEKKKLRNYKELYEMRNAAMKECHAKMETLSQARESLKDYHWAAQGAMGFLHNAEATFLSSIGKFVDCTEKQKQIHLALETLENGFQAHVDHLGKLVPHQPCLSCTKTKGLHIQNFSQLLVERAVLEAQAQLRLEALHRCSERQQKQKSCHEDVLRHLCKFEDILSHCEAEHITSYEKCIDQQKRAKEDLWSLTREMEKLRSVCPMHGCGAGMVNELGALWRRFAALQSGIGVLLAHTAQRAEEWKDIYASMNQCCSSLASLQAWLPDCSSGGGVSKGEPEDLLAQAELHRTRLEQEQRALASLEHRLQHALSLSHSQDPISPGPIGKTLMEIRESVRSLKERNKLVVEAAQAKEKEKQQVIEELTELEHHVLGLFPMLQSCSTSQQLEYKNELFTLKAKMQHIVDSVHSRYSEIPADICKNLQEVQLSLQRAEEQITERSEHVKRLAGQVKELRSGLERVKELLRQKSPSVSEAQNALKLVWDELDLWHGRLMLLESEVQDLAEDVPDQAHLLMDQLTEPLQCYQNTAQMVEHHTAFLGKIPACMHKFEDILYRATCWLDEAESWLGASSSFTTARSLQNHATSLQLLLEDSERIRHVLQEFRPLLLDISVVCEVSVQQKKLEDTDEHVLTMQQTILQPLGCFLQAAKVVEDFEAELKTVEKDVSKIEAILSSEDNGNMSVTEHLHNRQVILANASSMKEVLQEIQRVKEELNLPWAAEEQLLVFSKASSLLQHIQKLEQLPHNQASALENNIRKIEAVLTSKKPSGRKQDPDETIQAVDLQKMDEVEQLANAKAMDGLPNELDTSLGTTESWLLSVRPWLDTSTSEHVESDSETVDHGLDLEAEAEDSSPIHLTQEFQTPADNRVMVTCVALQSHGSQSHEAFVHSTSQSQTTAACEDTRLIPVRPITPFAAAVIFEEDEEGLSVSSSPIQELDHLNQSKEHNEMDRNYKLLNCPKEPVRLNCQDVNNQPLWSQLSEQISQKLSSLDKLQQDYQVIKDVVETRSTYDVLQQTQQTIVMLRQIVSSGISGEGKNLFDALKQVLLCLHALTDIVLTSVRTEDGDSELMLLQNECVTGQLTALTELLDQIETLDNPDASQCVTSLQQCLCTFSDKLSSQMGLTQLVVTNLSLMDDLDLKVNEMFQSLGNAPQLMVCVLAEALRGHPGERAELQQASQSLLQGMSRLVELGEACTTEGPSLSSSELQAALQRPKKLMEVLASQLAFAQYLFQHQPGALKCPEEEWVQLEVRAKALLQQALEQQVTSQRRLQEWTMWEDNCGQLGRLLDESEVFLSSQLPKGSEDGDGWMQCRIDGCQQNLAMLEKSRPTLGLVLDQGETLQSASVRQTGGALELQWRSIYSRTEQELKNCRDMQKIWASFQTDSASLCQWLITAKKQVQAWTELAASSDLKRECVHSSLIRLLDLCVEVGSMSVQKESVSRKASQLLRLTEADCPGLRGQITSLDEQFNQLNTDLTKTQELLQQHLLESWASENFLFTLEDWLQEIQKQLNVEKEVITKTDNSSLHRFKGLKTGLIQGRLLLDFLCQTGPQLVGEDAITLRTKRTILAEKLGDFRLCWDNLQGELENQINDTGHMHHICIQRQRKLQHFQYLIERQRKKLVQWKWPSSEYLSQKALLEWEGQVETLKDITAAVEELRETHLNTERGHTVHLAGQVEMLSHACEDLVQQMETQKTALHQTLEKWKCFKTYMNETSLYITRLHSSVLQLRAPIFSIQHGKQQLHNLQVLQSNAKKDEMEFWDKLDKCFQDLGKSIDPATVHALNGQIESERERWKETLDSLNNDLLAVQKTVSVWQEFTNLYERCTLQLQVLSQWENLCQHHQDQQAQLHALEEMQDTIESLKCELEDFLAASKSLIGQLNPTAYNIVQSQTSVLSHDVLMLPVILEGQKKRIKEEMERQNELHFCLETFEKQTKDLYDKISIRMNHMDSGELVFRELSYQFSSLIDVREMSAHVTLSNQEAQRLHILRKQYMENINQSFELYLQMHLKHQLSMDFEQKCKALRGIQESLEQESSPRNPLNYNSLKQMSAVHQKLQGDLVIGHKLLHGLLCDAVKDTENASEVKRSETIAQVSSIKQRWLDVLNMVNQRRSFVKQQLGQYTIYQSGLQHLCNLLRDIDPLLLPPGPVKCMSQIITGDYECFEETLQAHLAVYTRTVETGRSLCQSFTDCECQKQLLTEIQVLEQAWEHTTSLLGKQNTMVNTTVQKWSQCQARITELRFELDECGRQLEEMGPAKPVDSDTEKFIQETELSLQRLTGGLKEVDTMKMDLSQYVMMAGDSELLEQQLEQLHIQWEELCMKVSLRRQEIADRLNAWTIFNDKNKEFCDWLTQMENKVCHSADLSFEEMVEKLKKDCMEEINLFSENKSHLKQLGEQLLSASDQAKQSQVHGSLQEVNQRWHNLFHHIENRVKKLKETLVTVQQLDKNMNNLRSWLCRIEAELSRPITYSVLHHHEIQKRLAEHQELQRDIEQHTEGVASVLNLCDVLIRDEDAAGGAEADSDSLQETSRSLDQRWRTICAMALDRRLRIEETWRLWCKFLDDYSRFEDWLKMAERTAANPNTSDILYTEAKEELKKFEGFQRQVQEQLTQLEIVNNQYRRLARENRTDRSSQLKAMVHEGNRRWDILHRRVTTIIRRLKYFTSQREDFENTRESMLVWLTELDLQLTNVEHFSESDVHQKIQQLNSFQREITLNTERIDGLIVFGEGLIQKSSPQDAALIEEELEELHSYCQEVFGRLVRFHQRLSQPPIPEVSASFSLESSLELISRSWLGRSQSSLPATPTHLLTSSLSRSGRETPVSVDSLPLEWDHTGDVGGSSSHEDDEEDDLDDEGAYFSAVSSRSVCDSPRWRTQDDPELVDLETVHCEVPPTLASTPLKQGNYLHLMSQCSGSIEDFKRVSLILDDDESSDEFGLTGLNASGRQSGVIERWELLQAQSHTDLHDTSEGQVSCDLDNIRSWLDTVIPDLNHVQLSDPPTSVKDMTSRAKELKEMHKMFSHHKSSMLSLNLRSQTDPDLQMRIAEVNHLWSQACTSLQHWDTTLRKTLMRCQEFHESLHSLLLWLAHAESRRYAVDINHPETSVKALKQHRNTLTDVREELLHRQTQQASLHALWTQLQPEHTEDSDEAQEKLHVTGSKIKILLREVTEDLRTIQQRLENEPNSDEQDQRVPSEEMMRSKKSSPNLRERRNTGQSQSFFFRLIRAAFPLHVLLLLLLLLSCLVPMSPTEHSCTGANNFARSFYPMLHYTNGPPPT